MTHRKSVSKDGGNRGFFGLLRTTSHSPEGSEAPLRYPLGKVKEQPSSISKRSLEVPLSRCDSVTLGV